MTTIVTFKPVLSKTFRTGLYTHGSWGARTIEGEHTHTMDLYLHVDGGGLIEWDLPSIDTTESIGLWFDISPEGVRTLTDYDGIMALPVEAVALMREAGIVVTNDYDDGARFQVGDAEPVDHHEFVMANSDAPEALEWALTAKVGDHFPAIVNCRRVA